MTASKRKVFFLHSSSFKTKSKKQIDKKEKNRNIFSTTAILSPPCRFFGARAESGNDIKESARVWFEHPTLYRA